MTSLRVTVSQARTDGVNELHAGPVRLIIAKKNYKENLPLTYCGSAYSRNYDVTARVDAAK